MLPNQAALEGFLQSGLRNRIGELGGTGSPGMCWMVPRTVSECLSVPHVCLSVPLVNVLKFDFGVLSCRAKVAFMSCRFNVADAYVEIFFWRSQLSL